MRSVERGEKVIFLVELPKPPSGSVCWRGFPSWPDRSKCSPPGLFSDINGREDNSMVNSIG